MKIYKLYIVDLDGTMYRGSEAAPGAPETVAKLRRLGAEVRFVTNNSSQPREHYSAKLRAMGVESERGQVYSSAVAAAKYLMQEGLLSAFVVGEGGLRHELEREDIRVLNPANETLESEGAPEAVVAGICRGITYGWINAAMQQILRGARFVATNIDATYPLEGGHLEPGAGSIVAAVSACTGVDPFVAGKPNPFLIELVLEEVGILASDALVVGDRLSTDMEAGKRAGCDTHLVLTGVEKEAPPGQSWSNDLSALVG